MTNSIIDNQHNFFGLLSFSFILSCLLLPLYRMRRRYHYGFAKTNNDSDHGTFSHPHFQRDDIKSCLSIHRKRARVHIPKTTTTPEVLQSHDRSASPIRYPREKPIVLGRGDSPKYVEDKSRLPLPSCDNISRHLPSERPIRVNHAAIGSSTDSTFISAEASGAKNPRFINSTFESIAQGQRCLVQDEKFSNLQISKTLSDDWLGCLELWFQCTRVGYDGGSNDDENLMEPRTLEEMALYPISAISFSRDDY